jgi:hypothetical protein
MIEFCRGENEVDFLHLFVILYLVVYLTSIPMVFCFLITTELHVRRLLGGKNNEETEVRWQE